MSRKSEISDQKVRKKIISLCAIIIFLNAIIVTEKSMKLINFTLILNFFMI